MTRTRRRHVFPAMKYERVDLRYGARIDMPINSVTIPASKL